MKILLLAAAFGCAFAQEAPPPDVSEIMSRVAANQAQAQKQRKEWVYTQKQLLRMIRASGKVAREERREYAITPRMRHSQKELVHFEGKYSSHGKTVAYDKPGYEYKSVDVDGAIINSMSEDMTNDKDSRDGIDHDLFPLTAKEQKKYDFQLKGTEQYRNRRVFRVSFVPKPHQKEEDSTPWKGEALIDAEEYQPVLVTTRLAFKIPMAVRILLGTNIRGLGFSVSYQKFSVGQPVSPAQPEKSLVGQSVGQAVSPAQSDKPAGNPGVWFPVSYGGEFEVRAVFFYKRTISVSLTNSDFRRTDVTTNVAYAIEDK